MLYSHGIGLKDIKTLVGDIVAECLYYSCPYTSRISGIRDYNIVYAPIGIDYRLSTMISELCFKQASKQQQLKFTEI